MTETQRTSMTLAQLAFLLALTVLSGLASTTARAQTPVDLELVLAVDISLSMDIEEQRLQRDGYVQAFHDADVIKAIGSGLHRRIAVTYVEWAGSGTQRIVVPWTLIDSAAASHAFADQLAALSISRARMTSISGALLFASELFGRSTFQGLRRVIDVSGDGPNNSGGPVAATRDEVVGRGIIINGLPILLKPNQRSGFFDIQNLDQYYRDCVIGGPNAFAIAIRDRAEFPTAIRRKLLLEISGVTPPARIIPTQLTPPKPKWVEGGTDCLTGEKLWKLYMDGWDRDP